MWHARKEVQERVGQGRPQQALPDRRGLQAPPRDQGGEVRRERRHRRPSGRRSRSTPTRWSAARSCCRTAPARASASSWSPRATRPTRPGRGRGRRRRRGPGREDPEGELDRVRLDGRDARHDGSGRPARPRARPQGPDAEPEGRHGDDRRRQGGARAQGRPRRVPRREGRHRPGPHRQGLVRRREAARERPHDDRDAAAAQAAVGQGDVHEVGDRSTTMGPGIKVDHLPLVAEFETK